jgi:hypothetical protein
MRLAAHRHVVDVVVENGDLPRACQVIDHHGKRESSPFRVTGSENRSTLMVEGAEIEAVAGIRRSSSRRSGRARNLILRYRNDMAAQRQGALRSDFLKRRPARRCCRTASS